MHFCCSYNHLNLTVLSSRRTRRRRRRSKADQSLKFKEVQSVKKVQEMLRGYFEDVVEEELFYSMVFTVRLENLWALQRNFRISRYTVAFLFTCI